MRLRRVFFLTLTLFMLQDISVLIARRLKAVKKLKTNPNDQQTKAKIEDLDKQVSLLSVDLSLYGIDSVQT